MVIWRTLPSANIVACLKSLVAKSADKTEASKVEAGTRPPAAKPARPIAPSGYSH